MTTDTSHLDAIDLRLSHERARVAAARTPKDKGWREHNVRMIERERASEIEFLKARGWIEPVALELDAISDDELLALLG